VAIMFTDIEGYTALMQGDEAAARLTRSKHRHHFEVCTERFRGEIIQYYGDGTLSIFSSALEAVQCAIEMQHAWRQSPQIPVRIGIHLGDVDLQGGEVIGDAVNLASRVESAAVSGSIILSGSVFEQIKNHPTIITKPLGSFQFKNVQEAIDLYAVIGEMLVLPDKIREEAKMQKSFFINNLPGYPTPFIGRRSSLEKITELLIGAGCRLLTILGPGGLGKTRLSVEIGKELVTNFTHGICFVPLDTTRDHELVPQLIGAKLGLKEELDRSWLRTIIDFLKNKELLLILDNLEQILESSESISSLLTACPGVTVLSTSRETLNLPFEIEFPLDTFDTPLKSELDLKALLKNESCTLFVQKARMLNPHFEIVSSQIGALKEICIQLDGLPLALELAASRTKLFSVDVIRDRLENVFQILKSSQRGVSDRHQTIHQTIQWSYDLLDPQEQIIFCQMAIFPGSFSIEAVEEVCSDSNAVAYIESFINKSLLRKTSGPTARFAMLKVIHDFGASLLLENSERETLEARFAYYYFRFVRTNEKNLVGQDQVRWMQSYDEEYENLSQALDYLKRHDQSMARQFGSCMWRYYLLRGFITDGLAEINQLIQMSPKKDHTQAKLYMAAGILQDNIGDSAKAQEYFRESLKTFRLLNDSPQIAQSLNHLGWTDFRLGNYSETVSYARDALDICDQIDDSRGRLRALNNIAWTAMFRGSFEEALGYQEKILELAEKIGSPRTISFAKTCLAWALQYCGEPHQARILIEEAIDNFQLLEDLQMIAFSTAIKSEILIESGNMKEAMYALKVQALPLFESIGDRWAIAFCHDLLSRIHVNLGDYGAAGECLTEALQIREKIKDRWGITNCKIEYAGLLLKKGEVGKMNEYLANAIAEAFDMEANGLLIKSLYLRALGSTKRGELSEALVLLSIAKEKAQLLGSYLEKIWSKQFNKEIEKIAGQMEKVEFKRILEAPFSIQKILDREH